MSAQWMLDYCIWIMYLDWTGSTNFETSQLPRPLPSLPVGSPNLPQVLPSAMFSHFAYFCVRAGLPVDVHLSDFFATSNKKLQY